MSTIKQFEELLMWQKARELTRLIYLNFKPLNDFGFRDQIQRASVSIMSNIAEGFERGTKLEFLNYLYIAKGSAGEVRAQLYVALDNGYLNIENFKLLNGLVLDCSRLIASFIEKLKASNIQGQQYKKIYKKGPSDTNQFLMENNPKYKDYYDSEKDVIDFVKFSEDQDKKKDNI